MCIPHPLVRTNSHMLLSLQYLKMSVAKRSCPRQSVLYVYTGFSRGAVLKGLPASTGNASLIPGGGHGNPLQYSCLENSMSRGAWRASAQRIAKSLTQLTTHTLVYLLRPRCPYNFLLSVHKVTNSCILHINF